MIEESQTTIRNAGALLAQRGFHVVVSLLFAILVPRMMGPGDYGRFALVTSLCLWFVWGSDLGFSQIFGRYVPEFNLNSKKEGLQKFFSNLLAVGLLTGFVSGCLYLLFTASWLTDLDLSLLTMMAAGIVVQAFNRPLFTLFLGLNQAARWGMSEIFRHSILLILVVIGFYLGNLKGAILGMLLTELVVLLIGIGWGKSYFSWSEFRPDFRYLTPFLRFGLIFFVVNLLSSGFQYSGEVLVRLFYPDYVQVGYFGLAHSVYVTVARAVNQISIAFAPLMVTLLARGESPILKQWINQLIKWLTVGGMFVVFSVLLLADDLVPLVLGAAYQPVAMNLVPLSMTLWAQVLGSIAILIALVYDRPKIAMIAGILRLAAIWGFGPFFIAKWGSLGGCFAVLVASAIHAGYLTWRMQESIPYSLGRWLLVIGTGGIFLPLVWLRSSGMMNFFLYGMFAVGYLCILLFSRIITRDELATLWQAIGSKRRVSNLELR